jgi:hypothetical protein
MIINFPDVTISAAGSVRVVTEDALFWLRWNTDIRANDPGLYPLDHTITDAMAAEGFTVHSSLPESFRSQQNPETLSV